MAKLIVEGSESAIKKTAKLLRGFKSLTVSAEDGSESQDKPKKGKK